MDWNEKLARVEQLRAAVNTNPLDAESIRELWAALAQMQSGGELVRIYRALVLADEKATPEFAAAYRELGQSTGDWPAIAPEIRAALERGWESTRDEAVGWVLQQLG